MNLRFVDWVWRIRGLVPLAPGLSSDDVFNRLDSLFRETGTSHERTNDTLTFQKKDPAAQDKMSVFNHGVLQIERGATGTALRYDLTSWVLLFCFLMPLLFVGIAQLTNVLGDLQKPAVEASGKSGKTAQAQKPETSKPDVPMNPIDKFLGAPAPEKKGAHKGEEQGKKKPSPTSAYVFAAIFATLYVAGRILEDRLAKALFARRLRGAATVIAVQSGVKRSF